MPLQAQKCAIQVESLEDWVVWSKVVKCVDSEVLQSPFIKHRRVLIDQSVHPSVCVHSREGTTWQTFIKLGEITAIQVVRKFPVYFEVDLPYVLSFKGQSFLFDTKYTKERTSFLSIKVCFSPFFQSFCEYVCAFGRTYDKNYNFWVTQQIIFL